MDNTESTLGRQKNYSLNVSFCVCFFNSQLWPSNKTLNNHAWVDICEHNTEISVDWSAHLAGIKKLFL